MAKRHHAKNPWCAWFDMWKHRAISEAPKNFTDSYTTHHNMTMSLLCLTFIAVYAMPFSTKIFRIRIRLNFIPAAFYFVFAHQCHRVIWECVFTAWRQQDSYATREKCTGAVSALSLKLEEHNWRNRKEARNCLMQSRLATFNGWELCIIIPT